MVNSAAQRPLIGVTTYRKTADQNPPIEIIGLMPAYLNAVVAAGGVPIMIPLGLADEDLHAILPRIDGLLLPGGGDIDPAAYQGAAHATLWGIDNDRDRVEITVVRAAVAQQKPMLAICRGHQLLNVALGGSLFEDIAALKSDAIRHDFYRVFPRNYFAHSIQATPDSQIARLLGRSEFQVNSLHHQGIRALAPELTATAVAPDGLIEGVEVAGHPFAVGVQWHPENLITDDPSMLGLFQGLITAAGENGRAGV